MLLHTTYNSNRDLINPFTKKVASQAQINDLLNFHSIGTKEFLLRVLAVTLRQPAPNRRRRLHTFTEKKSVSLELLNLKKTKNLL